MGDHCGNGPLEPYRTIAIALIAALALLISNRPVQGGGGGHHASAPRPPSVHFSAPKMPKVHYTAPKMPQIHPGPSKGTKKPPVTTPKPAHHQAANSGPKSS